MLFCYANEESLFPQIAFSQENGTEEQDIPNSMQYINKEELMIAPLLKELSEIESLSIVINLPEQVASHPKNPDSPTRIRSVLH
jgi:hypothetical protein